MVSRRALQVVLAILSLTPFAGSLSVLILGAERFSGGVPVPAGIDHALRYQYGFYLGVALVIWYGIPRIERHGLLVVFLSGSIFLGGIGRLVSVLQYGPGDPFQYWLIGLELAMPLLIPWHRQVVRATAREVGTRTGIREPLPG